MGWISLHAGIFWLGEWACCSLPTRPKMATPASGWPQVATTLRGTSRLARRGGSGVLTTWIPRSERVKEGGQGPVLHGRERHHLPSWSRGWRAVWMADAWENNVSRSDQEWESRKQMGGLGPACPTGAAQVGERMWGRAVFFLLYSDSVH